MVKLASSAANLDLRAPIFTTLSKGIGGDWLQRIILVLVDYMLLSLAWHTTQTLCIPLDFPWKLNNLLLPIPIAHIGIMAARGLYNSNEEYCNYLSPIEALTLSHFFLLGINFSYQSHHFLPWSTFFWAWLLSILLSLVGRICVKFTTKKLRQQGTICNPIFIIGFPKDLEKATQLLVQENHYRIIGYLPIHTLGKHGMEKVIEEITVSGAAEVFVCSWHKIEQRMFLYWRLRNNGITLNILPLSLEEIVEEKTGAFLSLKSGVPFFKLSPPLIAGLDFRLKRCFDFCLAVLIILFLSPLYLAIALLIELDSPGPIFYQQTRVGLHGKHFNVWKFRTMVNHADKLQKELERFNEMKDGVLFKIQNDPRITKIGHILRRYSLDELPQVFNVICGEMSLVGPRPLPLRDIEKLSEAQLIRHEVLPGITGLWQISGRSEIKNFRDVLLLDISYIENWSLWLDLQILLKTIVAIAQKTGAY
ncbi:sugar transferase [Chroococcidiopsis sp.]|uniref:sugar transferase n=1 Tax=Chroococcidiopsis sp. TaxID=3088168 RepID=UPI003F2E6412